MSSYCDINDCTFQMPRTLYLHVTENLVKDQCFKQQDVKAIGQAVSAAFVHAVGKVFEVEER